LTPFKALHIMNLSFEIANVSSQVDGTFRPGTLSLLHLLPETFVLPFKHLPSLPKQNTLRCVFVLGYNVLVKLSKKQKRSLYKFLLTVLVLTVILIYSRYYKKDTHNDKTALDKPAIKCVDGDTFWLDDVKIRLIAIDAPEISGEAQPYGKEASDLTCSLLKNAKTIELDSDEGNTEDQYGRKLYWVLVDGELLQVHLLKQGYAQIRYVDEKTIDPDYYTQMKNAQKEAQKQQLGIWQP